MDPKSSALGSVFIDWVIAFPEITLVFFILSFLIYGTLNFVTMQQVPSHGNFNTNATSFFYAAGLMKSRNVGWLAFFVLFFCFFLLLGQNCISLTYLWNDLVRITEFSTLTKGFICLVCLGLFLISFDAMKHDGINTFEFSVLLLLSLLSMFGILTANDLLGVYLCIEMQSLSFYVLAAYKRTREFATEAGLKYFVLGVFSSGLLLFGSSLLYGFSGTTHFEEFLFIFINTEFSSFFFTSGLAVGILFLSIAFLFKLAAVPFHLWSPDVYEGSMMSVTLLFSTLPKIVTLSLMIRLFFQIFLGFPYPWHTLIVLSSIFSILWGTFASLNEGKIKRFMAFSGMRHVGYLLIGIATGGFGTLEQNFQSIQYIYFYLFVYIAMVFGTFTIFFGLRKGKLWREASEVFTSRHSTLVSSRIAPEEGFQKLTHMVHDEVARDSAFRTTTLPKYIRDLNGKLNRNNPTLALTLTVLMFSFAGIPPFAGFFSKVYLIFSAMEASLYLLAFVGLLASVLSAFYYLRFIKTLYFENNREWPLFLPVTREQGLILAIVLFVVMTFAFLPAPLTLTSVSLAMASM